MAAVAPVAFFDLRQISIHRHGSTLKVNIRPLQCEYFSAPQTDMHHKDNQICVHKLWPALLRFPLRCFL